MKSQSAVDHERSVRSLKAWQKRIKSFFQVIANVLYNCIEARLKLLWMTFKVICCIKMTVASVENCQNISSVYFQQNEAWIIQSHPFKLVADTILTNFHGFYFEVWRLTFGPDILSKDVSWPIHVDKVNQKVACELAQICRELQTLENLQTKSIIVEFFLWTQSRKNLIRLHLKFQVAY